MANEVDTKDCTALSDDEIAEIAELVSEAAAVHDEDWVRAEIGRWVLVSRVRESGKLNGFSMFTLERVGGTPAILIGTAVVRRNSKRGTVMRALVGEQLRRAVLAFPDEDVLYGGCLGEVGGVEAFSAFVFTGFHCIGALATRELRPFDEDRDGTVLGEAAVLLTMERYDDAVTRGAPILAEVLGGGLAADAVHMTAPAAIRAPAPIPASATIAGKAIAPIQPTAR